MNSSLILWFHYCFRTTQLSQCNIQSAITCSKLTIEHQYRLGNVFKVNNKSTRMVPICNSKAIPFKQFREIYSTKSRPFKQFREIYSTKSRPFKQFCEVYSTKSRPFKQFCEIYSTKSRPFKQFCEVYSIKSRGSF